MNERTDSTERTALAESTALVEQTGLVETDNTVEAEYAEDTVSNEDWRKAFSIVAIIHSRSFTNSRQAKKFIDALEETGHHVAARQFAKLWAEYRGEWMQSFMG
jgi:hypothetical protein